MPSFIRFQIKILGKKINEEKIKHTPPTPAQYLAYPISHGCFPHDYKFIGNAAFKIFHLTNGEMKCLNGLSSIKNQVSGLKSQIIT